MKFLLMGIVASLCALMLYPVVISVGQRVAQKLKKVQDEEGEEVSVDKDD